MTGRWIAVVSATLVAIAVALGVSLSGEEKWHVARGALDADCSNSGANPDGSVQFMVPCPRSATSPDRRWKIVQTPATGGEEEIYDVLVKTRAGASSARFQRSMTACRSFCDGRRGATGS
ncbi:MAG TPA: hypothetical protein PKD48_07695 [Sphingopyxis sp.]|nr:hypothetical protein [Sphingopyxis sp.]HMQ19428.1 hypothetical protein [Sphingopyxis sp.]